MVKTASTMPPLGAKAQPFSLLSTDGRTVTLEDFADAPGLLVMFICNHCPFVKHVREGLAAFGREYQERGLAIVAINSNDVTCSTRLKRLPKPTGQPARPTSSCSMAAKRWCIAASSIRAARAATSW